MKLIVVFKLQGSNVLKIVLCIYLPSSATNRFPCAQVKNPEKYGFEPKTLLDRLTQIYVNLDSDEFAQAVAGDQVRNNMFNVTPRPESLAYFCFVYPFQRSYKKELFDDAAKHLHKTLLRTEVSITGGVTKLTTEHVA